MDDEPLDLTREVDDRRVVIQTDGQSLRIDLVRPSPDDWAGVRELLREQTSHDVVSEDELDELEEAIEADAEEVGRPWVGQRITRWAGERIAAAAAKEAEGDAGQAIERVLRILHHLFS